HRSSLPVRRGARCLRAPGEWKALRQGGDPRRLTLRNSDSRLLLHRLDLGLLDCTIGAALEIVVEVVEIGHDSGTALEARHAPRACAVSNGLLELLGRQNFQRLDRRWSDEPGLVGAMAAVAVAWRFWHPTQRARCPPAAGR